MRLIFLLLISLNSFSQVQINGTGTPISINGTGITLSINPISYAKNVRLVDDVSTYDAFGHPQRTGEDRITYFYRSGTSHLEGGVIKARHYTISTDTWGEAFTIYTDPSGLDMRDVWGGRMDNDSIVLFSCASEYSGEGTSVKSHAFLMKGDLEMNFTDTVSIFRHVPELRRGLPFGGMMAGQTPGTYYIAMWQFNTDSATEDEATVPIYRIDVLKTTDYWNTWEALNVYNSASLSFSEAVVAVYPDESKMSVFARRDPGSFLYLFESSDTGNTWTARGNVTQLGLNSTKIKMPFAYINSSGLLDITVQDRSDGWLSISRNNDWSDYFGTNDINDGELYAFNRNGNISIGDNYKLGYPSMLEIEDGKYIYLYTRQESLNEAEIYYTLDDFTDDNAAPVAPPELVLHEATTTAALVYAKMDDAGGYTLEQLADIRYFEWSLSTDNFSTFVTTTVRYNGGDAEYYGEINNYRLNSHQLNIYDLTTGTTYQIRCRAVNLNGTSDWTTIEFTTL